MSKWDWKKILLYTIGGALSGTVGNWAATNLQGGHMAFTAGNILLPVLGALLPTLTALFTKPPHQP